MGSAPVRRGFEARLGSSVKRGAPVGPGMSGVYRVRRPRPAQEQAPAGRTPRGGSTGPVYWYDAADATTSDWPAHSGAGSLLTATGTPTLVPSAVNGQPGVRIDISEHYGGSESGHVFDAGVTFLYVVKMGANPGSFVQFYSSGGTTIYTMTDVSFGELEILYTDEAGADRDYVYNAPAGSAAYIIELTVSAAGVPSLKFAGVAQTPTSSSGAAAGTTEAVDFLQIGNAAQSPTICELMVFDADDSAGLSAGRSLLATKYALTA